MISFVVDMQARVHISGANIAQVLPFKGLGSIRVSSAHRGCIYLIKNMVKL